MTYANFDDHDTLLLGGKRVQGKVTVEVDLEDGLDIQKPKGGKAASIKDQGDPPITMSVEVVLFKQEHVDSFFTDILPLLRPKSKKAARDPLSCEHPAPNRVGVRNVVTGPIKLGKATSKDGWPITFKLIEWVPEVKQVNKSSTKPKDNAENWAPFVDNTARKEAPSHGDSPLTNLF